MLSLNLPVTFQSIVKFIPWFFYFLVDLSSPFFSPLYVIFWFFLSLFTIIFMYVCVTYLTNIADWSYIAGVNSHGRWKTWDGRTSVKPIDIATNNNGRMRCDRKTFQFRFVWWKRFNSNVWNWWKYNLRPVTRGGRVSGARMTLVVVGNWAILLLIVDIPKWNITNMNHRLLINKNRMIFSFSTADVCITNGTSDSFCDLPVDVHADIISSRKTELLKTKAKNSVLHTIHSCVWFAAQATIIA